MNMTESNYYSSEADQAFWSVSQYKNFMKCEAAALAKMNGEYQEPVTDTLLLGSYLDSWMDGTLDKFKQKHPEIFRKDGSLKAEYRQADDAIAVISADDRFMQFIGGEHQKIITFEMFGVPWKAKLDSYHEGICIVDLKYVRGFDSLRIYRYDLQGAVYQAGIRAVTGDTLPFWLAAVTKDKVPDHDLITVPQEFLDMALREIEGNIQHYNNVKHGFEPPTRCEKCDYCKSAKKARLRSYEELF